MLSSSIAQSNLLNDTYSHCVTYREQKCKCTKLLLTCSLTVENFYRTDINCTLKLVTVQTIMELSTAHTSDRPLILNKVLLLNKPPVYHTQCRMVLLSPPNRNHNPILTLTYRDSYYHQNLTFSSLANVSPFHQILQKLVQ